jgi:hypothetical protein
MAYQSLSVPIDHIHQDLYAYHGRRLLKRFLAEEGYTYSEAISGTSYRFAQETTSRNQSLAANVVSSFYNDSHTATASQEKYVGILGAGKFFIFIYNDKHLC